MLQIIILLVALLLYPATAAKDGVIGRQLVDS